MDKIFYVVWNPESGQSTHIHDHKELAMDESKRLSILNPDKKFFILKAVSYSIKKSCDYVELSTNDGIPF